MNNYKKKTDEELAVEYMNGDPKAFDEILVRYEKELYAYFLYIVSNHEEANELFQETFVKAVIHLHNHRYRPTGIFRYWLLRIAHNTVSDKLRKSETKLMKDANPDNDLSRIKCEEMTVDSYEGEFIRNQTFDELHRLVDKLPAEQRELVYLHFFEGLTFREIGEITGVSINTALGRMRYAILNLRKMMNRQSILSECITSSGVELLNT